MNHDKHHDEELVRRDQQVDDRAAGPTLNSCELANHHVLVQMKQIMVAILSLTGLKDWSSIRWLS